MGISHDDDYVPLFETRTAKGAYLYRVLAATILVGICFVWAYRLTHVPVAGSGRWAWLGLFVAEVWFGLYWVVTQSVRWNRVYRRTFKDRLTQRYEEKELPGVDIYVCTADPDVEPPIMVMNTVLSVMAFDYPTEKMAVYLSDDAGSDLTFYALLEASTFAKHWVCFCRRFKVEPRSPAAYFASLLPDTSHTKDLLDIKELYKQMEGRIESATKLGRVPEEERSKNAGLRQWESSFSSRKDHDTILEIVIDGEDASGRDVDGRALPTLVYLAREKRPKHHHNFKAGAMNSLIRVSSQISNAPIILNVDCDMYCNNSQSIKDALCFFMDEKQSHQIAYVQFPQAFENVTRNDVYGNFLRIGFHVDLYGFDGVGGPNYDGSGCFHIREILCGKKFSKDVEIKRPWNKTNMEQKRKRSTQELEEEVKPLAKCTYELNTQWGKEMGLRYGCVVEDVVTGLAIQRNGWKSAYMNPERSAFLGLAPTTLSQTLVQLKRWSEGNMQILMSKYNPVFNGKGRRISTGLQLCYLVYILWAPNCLPTLYYTIVPSLYLLKGVSLFPQVSSPWFLPFMYVILAKYIYSLFEFLDVGGTILGWWNDQRMWLYKRTGSFPFAMIDNVLKLLGIADSAFIVTAKVADSECAQRYEREMIEFGPSSPMFTIIATLALLNLFCLVGTAKKAIMGELDLGLGIQKLALQVILCVVLVVINWPLYQGLFLRKDKGRMPGPVTVKSIGLALLACASFSYY